MVAPLEDAYCTLLLSDEYLPGASVLAHSLRDAGTKKKLAVLVTLDTISSETITELKNLFDYVIPVDRLGNPQPANLYLMGRGDLAFAFTKIALWRQHQFRKLVYVDADIVALRAPDELFDLDIPFAAAPDIGWPDAFNTGLMVIKPNMGDYWALQTMASTGDSFDGADQGLLNQYYQHREWHRISFTYNCTPNAQYQWEPAYRYYKNNISLVHFIGKNKPWQEGRQKTKGGPGTYNELLARWWAVYDKHYKAPTIQYDAGASLPAPRPVQQHVTGEATSTDYGYTAFEHSIPTVTVREPEAPITTTEQSFIDTGELVENIEQGKEIPPPTVEQRRFSAPQIEWDATRMPPPAESKPEAANFPSQTYEFSASKELFQPPTSYPEPPKDMWYDIPKAPPSPAAKPKPIFPWEERPEPPKPTRIFIEDPIPSPESTPPMTAGTDEDVEHAQPLTPSFTEPEMRPPATRTFPTEPFANFSAKTVNAWDNHPGIDNYARAFENAIARRSGNTTHARHQSRPANIVTSEPLSSPTVPGTHEPISSILAQTPTRRRESLILTDFPTAIERPSLPVTPAPIRRPSFWGAERNEAGHLPAAEGVPEQSEWDPEKQLEYLRKWSLVTAEEAARRLEGGVEKDGEGSRRREVPRTSVGEGEVVPPKSGGGSPHGLTAVTGGEVPGFRDVGFGEKDGGLEGESALVLDHDEEKKELSPGERET
ncbi:MAG: glycogenin glucosyltransferase [Bogoriella megaspora]|nr:MAG: glycogenin glucosyltransferase [Bogoriella megaspora]